MRYFLAFCFLSFHVHGQSELDLMGFLFVENARPISYRMILEEEDGVLNGYSITGIGTNFETKSELFGSVRKKKIELKEFQILSTFSEEPISSFCFLEFSAEPEKKKSYVGTFIGRYPDSTICAQGKIVFAEKAKIEKKIKQVQKIQDLVTKKADNKLVVLKSGEEHIINWQSKKLKMQLWDSALEDNDRMTVLINGEKILSNKKMLSKKEIINYRLIDGENIVEIIADSEGDRANNTTRIELIDKKTKHAILSELQVGKKITIKIYH
jgi:hypothetical protein